FVLADPNNPLRPKADERITELATCAKAKSILPPPSADLMHPEGPTPQAPRHHHGFGIASAGVGLVLAAVGVVEWVIAVRDAHRVADMCGTSCSADVVDSLDAQGKRAQAVAPWFYAGGAVGLAVGAGLYFEF